MGSPYSCIIVGDSLYVEVKPDNGEGTFWYKTTIAGMVERNGGLEVRTVDIVTGGVSSELVTRPDSSCPTHVQSGHVFRFAKHNWRNVLPRDRLPKIEHVCGSETSVKSPKQLRIEIVGDWALIGAQFYQPEEDSDEHLFFCVRLDVLCELFAGGLLTPFDKSDNYKYPMWCEDWHHVNEEADDARKALSKPVKPLSGYKTATEAATAEAAAIEWKKSIIKKTQNTVSPNFPKRDSTPPIDRALTGSAISPVAARAVYSGVATWATESLVDVMQQKLVNDLHISLNPSTFQQSQTPSLWQNQYGTVTDFAATGAQNLKSLYQRLNPSTKEATMANPSVPTTAPTPFSKTVADVGDAVVHGASVAAAQEAYDTILELTTAAGLPSSTLGFLQSTMFGRVLLYIGVPTVLMFLCNMFPSSIPQADNVNRACKLVVDGASRDFLRPMFLVMSSPLKKLASIGATVVTTPPSEQK